MVCETLPDRVEALFISEEIAKEAEDANHPLHKLTEQLSADSVHTVSAEVMKDISDTVTPQGVLAIVRMKRSSLDDILCMENPLILVLCDLQDPGNLGTIIRTAEGAGADAVIMSKGCVDIYSPKVVRSTMGSLYRVPFIITDDILSTLEIMKDKGIRIYGAELQGSVVYDECDYTAGSAILIGNEGVGLSNEVLSVCDERIRIPMEGSLESLNAAVSAGIIVYEAAGQRRKSV